MMVKKEKIIILCLLILIGSALFIYGVFFHSTNVLPQQDEDSAAVAHSEPALIKESTVGGVSRDESGELRKTYTGEPPTTCPT